MAMEVTSAVANKLLRNLNEDLKRAYDEEGQCCTYTEVDGVEPAIPTYKFEEIRSSVEGLMDKIVRLKHAINVFNSVTVLPESGLTIDSALVYMAMLNKEKSRLENMIIPVKRKLKTGYGARSGCIEYEVLNYDADDVRAKYNEVSKKLSDIQIELDVINSTVTFKIDI